MKMDSSEQKDATPEIPAGTRVTEKGAVVKVLGCPLPRWGRWGAVAAFMFFLIKGLLWLSLPAILVAWRSCSGE